MATTIETDLKEVLGEIKTQLNQIQGDITDLKITQAEIKGELSTLKVELNLVKEDVKDLKISQRSQIWALIITVMGATITAVVKFGFFPNP